MEKFTSYTRVEAHLLQKSGRGIIKCDKMPYEVLCEMKREVKRCEELVQRGKARTVSMPTASAPAPSGNTSEKKRGPASALEKAWALEDRKHLDALIVRSIYSGGMLCICIDCYKLFTYVEHRTMKHLLCICIDCYLYVEHRFLIVVNFDMHCLYLILLKKLKRIHVSEFFGRVPYRPRY